MKLIYIRNITKKSFLVNDKSQKSYLELEVNQIRLSKYLDQKNLDKIDFLKVDTEGYEYNVLKGLDSKLSTVTLIMFEHHYDDMLKKNYTFRDIHQLLISNNIKQIYKYKMSIRKTNEYIYEKNDKLKKINVNVDLFELERYYIKIFKTTIR